ncbi:MAG: hypothetical protein IT158_19605 [Bryobacterales bacterium]|nr:hypothetical protein [Bryobacterales bacterium]
MRLDRLTRELYATAPPLAQMKGRPDYDGWAEALGRLADRPEMEPFRGVFRELAGNALVDLQPLNRFLQNEAEGVSFESNRKAAEAAVAEISAPAAFLATFVCARTWIRAAGPHLYRQDSSGRPSPAWTIFPQALVSAAMRVGSWLAARAIAEEAYDVLFASKYSYWEPIQAAMERSREQAHECLVAFERAVRDLADDLREACAASAPNVRAEFGAILWTLGLIPQSLSYDSRQPSSGLPSRRLAREIVRRSMHRMRHDRLLQYVWLELKNNEGIPIRSHQGLFAIINNQFPDDQLYTQLEILIGNQPGQSYARALAGWFRGTLGAEEKDRYIQLVSEIASMTWPDDLLHTLPRMYYLAMFLGRRSGWPPGFSADDSEDFRLMRGWVGVAADRRRRLAFLPELPDPQTVLNLSLHEILELELTKRGDGADSPAARAWDMLEDFRGSALEYWMSVTPPAYPDREMNLVGKRFEREEDRLSWSGGIDRMLFEEEQRMAWLRGAYFLILSESLPEHFQRYAADSSNFYSRREKGPVLDPETGRKEYFEIRGQLRALYERLAPELPEYSRQRTQTHASWTDVVAAANAHRRGSMESRKASD